MKELAVIAAGIAASVACAGETGVDRIDGSNPLVKTRFTADPAGYSDGEWFYVFMGHDDDRAKGYLMFDPSVMIDDDGKAYLFWGNHGGDPGMWYAELKENMVAFASEIKPVPGLLDAAAFGEPLKWPRRCGPHRQGSPQTNFVEAPWIYKVGDTYYLEYASGGLPEKWSYSTAKSIHGPWKFGGKIMDNAGGTHTIHGGSVFHKGEWYMLYHDGNKPGGGDKRRSVRIERYRRNPDGTIPFIRPTAEGVKPKGDGVAGS